MDFFGDDDDVVEAIQLDLQEENLDSADGLEASDTPGATQNEQNSRVLDDEFEVDDLRHPNQPPPPYAEVADLFNALEVRAAGAAWKTYPFFSRKRKWHGSGLSPVGNPSKVIFEVSLMRR